MHDAEQRDAHAAPALGRTRLARELLREADMLTITAFVMLSLPASLLAESAPQTRHARLIVTPSELAGGTALGRAPRRSLEQMSIAELEAEVNANSFVSSAVAMIVAGAALMTGGLVLGLVVGFALSWSGWAALGSVALTIVAAAVGVVGLGLLIAGSVVCAVKNKRRADARYQLELRNHLSMTGSASVVRVDF